MTYYGKVLLQDLEKSVSIKKINCGEELHRVDYLSSQKLLVFYGHPIVNDDDVYINQALAKMGKDAPLCFQYLEAFREKRLYYDFSERKFWILDKNSWTASGNNSISLGMGTTAGGGGSIIITGGSGTSV